MNHVRATFDVSTKIAFEFETFDEHDVLFIQTIASNVNEHRANEFRRTKKNAKLEIDDFDAFSSTSMMTRSNRDATQSHVDEKRRRDQNALIDSFDEIDHAQHISKRRARASESRASEVVRSECSCASSIDEHLIDLTNFLSATIRISQSKKFVDFVFHDIFTSSKEISSRSKILIFEKMTKLLKTKKERHTSRRSIVAVVVSQTNIKRKILHKFRNLNLSLIDRTIEIEKKKINRQNFSQTIIKKQIFDSKIFDKTIFDKKVLNKKTLEKNVFDKRASDKKNIDYSTKEREIHDSFEKKKF